MIGNLFRSLGNLLPRRNPPPTAGTRIQSLRKQLQARYDAVQTTDKNERHWAMADGLSARMATNPAVRLKFRNRTRYEVANNSYASGIVQTLANHTIGTGPRLQVTTPNPETNDRIEKAFRIWSRRVRLAEKLRTLRTSRAVDGEAFAILGTNPQLPGPVQLDLQLVEAEQITTPFLFIPTPTQVDGIVFDDWGNPKEYHKLLFHPGDQFFTGQPFKFERVPAASVIHLFRVDRPGQARGIPELAPALPLFAMLRRFALATTMAAESAAEFAAVMYTDAPATGEAEALPEDQWFDPIAMEMGSMLTLPNGWKVGQVKAEHPNTTFDSFKRSTLQEIARCLNMPYNIAAGDSSSYNYSSGRLDHQTYFRSIEVDQAYLEVACLDRILLAFLEEAMLVEGLLPDDLGLFDELPHQWFWDSIEDIDPEKTANAANLELTAGISNRARLYASQGLDIDEEDAKAAETYGVSVEEYRKALFQKMLASPQAQPPADPGQKPAPRNSKQRQTEDANALAAA